MPGAESPLLLGVRHHGPGSARAVRRALAAYRPDIVLIEGPPEADALIPLAASEQMRPPVALLAYTVEPKPTRAATPANTAAVPLDGLESLESLDPPDSLEEPARRRKAAYWPFAEFSPEWQAIRWCLAEGVPVRFCDLPAALSFAQPVRVARPRPAPPPVPTDPAVPSDPDGPGLSGGGELPGRVSQEAVRADPIGMLALAAGYDDAERWWEDVVEHRLPTAGADELELALAPFAAIAEAMAAVRTATPAPDPAERIEEDRREAYMRTVLRTATKEHGRVAVVCGAWHVPALTAPLPSAKADATVLKGLPKVKVSLTWVPWTHGRLASWQGYGAGVASPGWYHHLFSTVDRPVARWLVDVARLLREEDQPVSSAHVIEAIRLAEALAALRGRPLAGLAEVTEATRAVLCDGNDVRLALVQRRLVVGERLGAVPEETPSVPLVVDVAAAQRRLRLPPSALVSDVDLDLRRDIDLDRSRLLYRLRLLGIEWGEPTESRRGQGTFWESWRLAWRPEFAIDLIEAGGYGTTLLAAATARSAELAGAAETLAAVTGLVEQCLLADLADALPAVLTALDARVALDADVVQLMAALPALARTLRYGDVRGTDVSAMGAVTHGLVVRICVGLPAAVVGLDESAATELRGHLDAVHAALGLLGDTDLSTEWMSTLERLAGRDDLHGLLAGRLTRLLLDGGRLVAEEAGRRLGLILTVGEAPARAAAWIEGFLAGGGLLLVHDERMLSLVDGWLADIAPETFIELLPLLRRTFSRFAAPERRAIGERARQLDGRPGARHESTEALDRERAALVLPTLRLLLGRDVLFFAEESV